MNGILDNFRPDVREEYKRICSSFLSDGDPYFGGFTIGLQEIFDAHFLLVDYFFKIGEGIGGVGRRILIFYILR